MSSPNPVHEFKMTHGDWPVTTPSTKDPSSTLFPSSSVGIPWAATSPTQISPSFTPTKTKTTSTSILSTLCSLLDLTPPSIDPRKKGAQTFWMKTYSENKGMLELLEELGVLRRTGQTYDQGFVTLVAIETVLVSGQWAEVCHHCGRREQLGTEEERMKRCVKRKDAYYCNIKSQKEN